MVKLATSTTPPSANTSISSQEIPELVWAAMEKIGKKELTASKLEQGTSHSVSLQIAGSVDGRPFFRSVDSMVSVGESYTKSSSVNPQIAELLAWVLSKLNEATKNRILTDIPTEFAENGGMPNANPAIVDAAKRMLKSLRQTKQVTARGPIQCDYVFIDDIAAADAVGAVRTYFNSKRRDKTN